MRDALPDTEESFVRVRAVMPAATIDCTKSTNWCPSSPRAAAMSLIVAMLRCCADCVTNVRNVPRMRR